MGETGLRPADESSDSGVAVQAPEASVPAGRPSPAYRREWPGYGRQTEPTADRREPVPVRGWFGAARSARTRILATYVVLLALSAVVSILAIRQVLLIRLDDQVADAPPAGGARARPAARRRPRPRDRRTRSPRSARSSTSTSRATSRATTRRCSRSSTASSTAQLWLARSRSTGCRPSTLARLGGAARAATPATRRAPSGTSTPTSARRTSGRAGSGSATSVGRLRRHHPARRPSSTRSATSRPTASAATLGILLLASAVAWLIAGRVLAPVRQLTETARSISRVGPDPADRGPRRRRGRRDGAQLQRDARPARDGLPQPARVRPGREPRAARPADDLPRPPRAARRRPRGAARRRRRSSSTSSTGWRGSSTTSSCSPRPSSPTSSAASGSTSSSSTHELTREGDGARHRGAGRSTRVGERSDLRRPAPPDRGRDEPRAQRGAAHRRRTTRSRSAARSTRRRGAHLGPRHGLGHLASPTRRGSSSASSAGADAHRALPRRRARPRDRQGDRRGARRPRRAREPPRRGLDLHDRHPARRRARGARGGPDPDRRGRPAHRVVPREGPARERLLDLRRRRRRAGRSASA